MKFGLDLFNRSGLPEILPSTSSLLDCHSVSQKHLTCPFGQTTTKQDQLSSATRKMAFFPAIFLLMLLARSAMLASAVNNVFHPAQDDVFLRGVQANLSTNTTFLSAPYYRSISPGAAWVIPRSIFDLGARDMTCECFDPSRKLTIL